MRTLTRSELTAVRAAVEEGRDALLRVPEAAARVGVNLRTLRSWIREDRVAVTIVGGQQCVVESHVSDVEHGLRSTLRTRPGRPRR